MFTGIIESLGIIRSIENEGSNVHFIIKSSLTPKLKIDQSLAHNGVCLTVVSKTSNSYKVTAVSETLNKTNLGKLKVNDYINLERAIKLGDRLDGHIVQGHVDQTATCIQISERDGSWFFTFKYNTSLGNVTIEKGSVAVNGVSLTVVNSDFNKFSVAIIPYTYEHSTFKTLEIGSIVNLEFDVIGKYIKRLVELKK